MYTVEPDLMLIWYNRHYVGADSADFAGNSATKEGKGKEKNKTCRWVIVPPTNLPRKNDQSKGVKIIGKYVCH